MKKLFLLFLMFQASLFAQSEAVSNLESQKEKYSEIAHTIWEYAEMGYQEEKSSALLQKTLEDEGFKIEKGVAGIPTAFIAEYGNKGPVIAILGEYDALPGLSQKAVPEKAPGNGEAGHACGHHLFGTASTAAAIEVKKWLEKNNQEGIIRFYGCPAEEGGSGKVYMVRAGLFDDVDVVLNWHPSSKNAANPGIALANKSAKFRFYGKSAHAASAPEQGRSALDAVEAMNYMVNMMREHVPATSRIHYVITSGGKAPNVIPDYAEVYYYSRHPNREEVKKIFDRMVKAAEGAAIGTGTTMKYEIIGGTHELLPNLTLQKLIHENMTEIGGFEYTAKEKEFAEAIAPTLDLKSVKYSDAEEIEPFSEEIPSSGFGSTDVGDVSFAVPTGGLRTATWVPGTPAHSWQAVASGGMSIGEKGMLLAAKTLAVSAIDLFKSPELIEEVKLEFNNRRGDDFIYEPLIGDREPALDYRK
ncbi:amidohydrolase [Christiangramia crocea]|uniref:Amidohydrolase n=1 Tax=Christiangramia crocea TaxID=2904124 RepID=A0A9X1UUI3_9FLAO|nr:amidohydrolase [Gramella crocea]MCG9970346.1 amidohydrolase [Gramella crocea]